MHLVRADDAAPAAAPPPPADPARLEERRLVALIRAGDAAAFETLFRLHAAPLGTFARHLVGSRDAAADVVQEVFLALWRGRSALVVQGTLRAYLYRATRNRALDALKHAGAHARWADQAAREHAIATDAAEPGPDHVVDAQLDAPGRAAALDRALAELPDRGRLVVLLRWREGMSYAEIGALLDIAPRTVEVHLRRAFRTLRARLRGRED